MNATSADGPSPEEAYRLLNLETDYLILWKGKPWRAAVDGTKDSKSPHCLKLFPWQVVGVAWLK